MNLRVQGDLVVQGSGFWGMVLKDLRFGVWCLGFERFWQPKNLPVNVLGRRGSPFSE